jgi:hypothetical protein
VVKDSLEAFWNLEHLGMCEDLQDDREMIIKESLKRDGPHYQVEWPMTEGKAYRGGTRADRRKGGR